MTGMVSRSRPHVDSRRPTDRQPCLIARCCQIPTGTAMSQIVGIIVCTSKSYDGVGAGACSARPRCSAGVRCQAPLGEEPTAISIFACPKLELRPFYSHPPTTRTFSRYVFIGNECPSESQEKQSHASARMNSTLLLLCDTS
jgi:hypothetical protein